MPQTVPSSDTAPSGESRGAGATSLGLLRDQEAEQRPCSGRHGRAPHVDLVAAHGGARRRQRRAGRLAVDADGALLAAEDGLYIEQAEPRHLGRSADSTDSGSRMRRPSIW